MRILVITPYFYPHIGGSQQYAEELHVKLMQLYPNVKVDVLCYNTDNSPLFENYRGMRIYRIPCFQPLKGQFAIPNYFILIKTLKKLIKKNKYSLINSHTRFFENSWWVPFVGKIYGIRTILTDHCANHPVHTSSFVNVIAQYVDKIIIPFISRQYSSVAVTNSATRNFLRHLGVIHPHIIYGGVDTKFFAPISRTKKRTIPGVNKNITKDTIIISFVGRMISSKGPHLLYKSAQTIIRKYPQAIFVFAGDGPLLKSLSSKQNNQIFFLGGMNRHDIAALLSVSDILVHPSLHHEGFPNVLLEAGSSGCAVIATDMGGTHEIITHNKTGLFVNQSSNDITKSIQTLIADKKLRDNLSKNLRQWILSKYDWTQIAHTYHTHIDMLLKRE